MKTSKILLLFSAIFCLASCSDDEASVNVLDTTEVSVVENVDDCFVDKDGRTYKCVKIGNQIWMAENLAYYLPEGPLDGCYTWKQAEIDMEWLEGELSKKKELTGQQWAEIVYEIYESKSDAEWTALGEDANALWEFYYYDAFDVDHGWMSIEDGDRKAQQFPAFYALLQEAIAGLNKTSEQLIKEKTDAAEKSNGNDSQKNGFFYTLDGAKAAIPEGSEWRVPSDEDWKKLEATLGMSGDLDVMNAWRGTNAGDYLKVDGAAQFNAIFAGCNAWQYNREDGGYWINRDYSAYFWCSDESTRMETETPEEGETDEDGNLKEEETYEVREGIVRQVSIYTPKIWRGITRLEGVCYSVRFVKDAN